MRSWLDCGRWEANSGLACIYTHHPADLCALDAHHHLSTPHELHLSLDAESLAVRMESRRLRGLQLDKLQRQQLPKCLAQPLTQIKPDSGAVIWNCSQPFNTNNALSPPLQRWNSRVSAPSMLFYLPCVVFVIGCGSPSSWLLAIIMNLSGSPSGNPLYWSDYSLIVGSPH